VTITGMMPGGPSASGFMRSALPSMYVSSSPSTTVGTARLSVLMSRVVPSAKARTTVTVADLGMLTGA
jgi:hypothetical protein